MNCKIIGNKVSFNLDIEDTQFTVLDSIKHLRQCICQIPRKQILAVIFNSREDYTDALSNLELMHYITSLRALTFKPSLDAESVVYANVNISEGELLSDIELGVTTPSPNKSLLASFKLVIGTLPYISSDIPTIASYLKLDSTRTLVVTPSGSRLNAYANSTEGLIEFVGGPSSSEEIKDALEDMRKSINRDIDNILKYLT